MATLKTNTLTGTSTAGSIAVTGEGGSTTTNLQQGLAKIFCSIQDNQTLLSTSLNTSSWTDTTTGSGLFDFTNAITEVSHQVGVASQINASGAGATVRGTSSGSTTSRYDTRSYDGSNSASDHSFMSFVIHGDLA
tara:strand:- start:429 stop:833 length:405 start_codon:yes stop_codon:yes gene_type:complete